MLDKHQLC